MRPVFVALISLGLIISNGKSAPTNKQNIEWHECIDECMSNFDKHMRNTGIKAFLVPQIAAWLNLRNQSISAMLMEGVMGIDTRKNKNDLDLCLSECHIYHVRPIDNVFEEGLEKVQKRLEDFNKDLSLTLGKNKPQSIHEQLIKFENEQGGLATRKDRFDEAISEFEAAFPEETQPKEDDSEEEL